MTWESDAALAGQLDKGHKVYLTMLIARSVEPGEGQGRKNLGENSPKTSQSAFAEYARVDKNTVGKYLKTWDAMAEDGIVPPREELTPGVDVDLPDQAKWRDYYREANAKEVKKKDPFEKATDDANFLHAIHTGLSKKRMKLLSPKARQMLKELLTEALNQLEEE